MTGFDRARVRERLGLLAVGERPRDAAGRELDVAELYEQDVRYLLDLVAALQLQARVRDEGEA